MGWDLGGDEGLDLLILNRVAVLGKEPNLREGEKGRGGEGRRYIGRERGEEAVREAQRGRGLKSSRQRMPRMVGISVSVLYTHPLVAARP